MQERFKIGRSLLLLLPPADLFHALDYGRHAARLVAQREDLAGSAEQMARARLRGELKARRRGGSVRTAPLRRVHHRECLGGALRACVPGGVVTGGL